MPLSVEYIEMLNELNQAFHSKNEADRQQALEFIKKAKTASIGDLADPNKAEIFAEMLPEIEKIENGSYVEVALELENKKTVLSPPPRPPRPKIMPQTTNAKIPIVQGINLPKPPPRPPRPRQRPSTAVIKNTMPEIARETIKTISSTSRSSTSTQYYSISDDSIEKKLQEQKTVDQHSFAYFKPAKVDNKDLQTNGLLLTDEQIDVVKKTLTDKPEDARYGKKLLGKNSTAATTMPFGTIKVEGELYAVYYGQKKQKHLGKGSFGKVKLVQKLTGPDKGKWCALKVLYAKDSEEHIKLNALKKAYGKHFSRFGKERNEEGKIIEKFHILMDLAQGMELMELLTDKTITKSPIHQLDMASALLDALDEVHKLYIHRDLKPENLFYDLEKKIMTILDFGLARDIKNGTYKSSAIEGTPLYIAPELLESLNYSKQTDYYAAGRIFQDIFGIAGHDYYYREDVDPPHTSPLSEIPDVQKLAAGMTAFNPSERFDMTAVREKLDLIRLKVELIDTINTALEWVNEVEKKTGVTFKAALEENLHTLKTKSFTSIENAYDETSEVMNAFSNFIKEDIIPTKNGPLLWKPHDKEATIRNQCEAKVQNELAPKLEQLSIAMTNKLTKY